MNNNDCGCDTPINMLNNNLNTNNINGNNLNQNIMNNVRQGNNNTKYINNMEQNHQNINNNPNLNAMIATPNTSLDMLENNEDKKPEKVNCKKEVRLFLYVLLALSVNEMVKFFINQSIRLNKGSSNRYLFYPILVLVVLVIVCLL
tara:strand:- start:129 stop:566 length:438 start_codon:yes stop_codon:yes gene_type:complete